MTLVMVYVILITACVAACAVVLEAFLRGRGAGARWVWVLAMGVTIAATLFAMIAPRPIEEVAVEHELVASNLLTPSADAVPLISSSSSVSTTERLIEGADLLLPAAWLIATLLLLVALGVGQRRFRIERRAAREANVVGHAVLLTENLGPAVAGVRRPVVFVPRWVLALDDGSQRLLLAHEVEHVKGRDTSLLLFGAVTAALTPWNPVVWWMVRRLRLAVEQDCDARVLATYPGVRRYADLLLMAASRHGLTARLLAAHFGEHTSDLLRRIEAMTSKSISLRKVVGAGFVAAALVAAACETPRPDPVAPIATRDRASADERVAGDDAVSAEFSKQRARCTKESGPGCQISVIVLADDGKELARYAGEIPVAHLPEKGIQKINVENGACGENTCSLIWIRLKPDASLKYVLIDLKKEEIRESAVLQAERRRFEAWKVDSAAPREFEKASSRKRPSELKDTTSESSTEVRVPARIIERDGDRVARGEGVVIWPLERRVILRDQGAPGEMPSMLVRTSDGSELRRFVADTARIYTKSPIDDIKPEDIAAIEVYKGTSCPVAAKISCPLIVLILKPGTEGKYRPR